MKKMIAFLVLLGAAIATFADTKYFINGKEVDEYKYGTSFSAKQGTQILYDFLDEDELSANWWNTFIEYKEKKNISNFVAYDYKSAHCSEVIDYIKFPEDYKAFIHSDKPSVNALLILSGSEVQKIYFIGDTVHITFYKHTK